jgi:thiol-disulfide isomerase/thioredoxin
MKKIILTFILAIILVSCSNSTGTSPTLYTPSAKVTLLEFTIENCSPCKWLKPVLDSISQLYDENDFKLEYIDYYENQKLAGKYNIMAFPSQVFLDSEGKDFYINTGSISADKITELLKERNIYPKKK